MLADSFTKISMPSGNEGAGRDCGIGLLGFRTKVPQRPTSRPKDTIIHADLNSKMYAMKIR